MKTKFLLPALAMIFAIGMSFATENKQTDPNTDYVLIDGNFRSIKMELNCPEASGVCTARLKPGGQVYEVYDAADPNTLKPGDGTTINVWEQQ